MKMHGTTLKSIDALVQEFHERRKGKESLLMLLEETELPEAVYNSNAIENSTLTLDETERILFHQEIPPFHTQREVFEAINLAKVTEYLNEKVRQQEPLTVDLILLVHKTLLSHINEGIAGRLRQGDEYVRVGRHIAPAPVHVPERIANTLDAFHVSDSNPLQRIIQFHLEFEHIHPFCDGNGRVGRALMQFQLKSYGYPPVIVRNKEKRKYYASLAHYDDDRSTKEFERIFSLLLKESLHKRIAYLRGDDIMLLSTLGKKFPDRTAQSLTNAAKQQSVPAFRVKGRWHIGRMMFQEWKTNR